MTNYQAVKADLLRYTVSRITIEKALILAGLSLEAKFDIKDQRTIATIVIKLLRGLITVKSESDSGSSQSFDKEGLIAYINVYARDNNLEDMICDLSETSDKINDRSNFW
nr:DUF6706 family protein [Parabacteroides goldsteinii]